MTIIETAFLQADVDLVWKAWTQAERVTQWFAPGAAIEPVVGGKYELYFDPSDKTKMSTAGCVILQYEAPQTLVFQWKGPDPFAHIMNHADSLTQVKVSLEPSSGGTQVTVEHTGWGQSEAWQEAREWHVAAWKQVLASLKSKIESGEGMLCCQ